MTPEPAESRVLVFSPYGRKNRTALAGAAAVVATLGSLPWTANPGMLFAGLGVMLVGLGFRLELRLDLAQRRFERLDGVWPLRVRRAGSFDELSHLRVDLIEQVTHTDFAGAQTVKRTFVVDLVWKRTSPATPWRFIITGDFEGMARRVQELAEALGVPLAETPMMRSRREELGPAPYDALIRPPEDAPVSLAAKLRR